MFTNFGERIYELGYILSAFVQTIEDLITYHERDLEVHYNMWYEFGQALGKIMQIGLGVRPGLLNTSTATSLL